MVEDPRILRKRDSGIASNDCIPSKLINAEFQQHQNPGYSWRDEWFKEAEEVAIQGFTFNQPACQFAQFCHWFHKM